MEKKQTSQFFPFFLHNIQSFKKIVEKCQCQVSVVWAEGMGNLPPTNLPPQTALGVICVSVKKYQKKNNFKKIYCMNF